MRPRMKGDLLMTQLLRNIIRSIFLVAVFAICILSSGEERAYAETTTSSSSPKIELAQSHITKVSIKEYKENIKHTKSITVKHFFELLKKHRGKSFYLFFGFKECPYCRKFSPTLKLFSMQRQVRPIYYVNVDTFGVNDRKNSKVYKYVQTFIGTKIRLKSTPTVVGIKNGYIIGQYNDSKTTLQQLNKLQKKMVVSKK